MGEKDLKQLEFEALVNNAACQLKMMGHESIEERIAELRQKRNNYIGELKELHAEVRDERGNLVYYEATEKAEDLRRRINHCGLLIEFCRAVNGMDEDLLFRMAVSSIMKRGEKQREIEPD